MDIHKLENNILNKEWENRVQRPGFLQSKLIAAQAINLKTKLTKNISVKERNNIWVKTSALYDQRSYNELCENIFPVAFKQNKKWPLNILKYLNTMTKQKNRFIKILLKSNWKTANLAQKLFFLDEYVKILKNIQKLYVIAVPLTNYCENFLTKKSPKALAYAFSYSTLDIDKINQSLLLIKKLYHSKNSDAVRKEILNHLRKFRWIKTNYNIKENYTIKEVLEEIKADIQLTKKPVIPKSLQSAELTGLQVGIYIRNRVKELSQQIWFAYENLAKQLAIELNLKLQDFLQLTIEEVIQSLKKGRLIVNKTKLSSRHRGFIAGILDEKEIIITGKIVNKIFNYFNETSKQKDKAINGKVAYMGLVKGRVKLILNPAKIKALKKGQVLITSMTTPDFIVAMKRAAAIVTDEGGLSCHAAIISRELEIPCIIGTKFATKIFKDGDMVEVDANKGIVRKI